VAAARVAMADASEFLAPLVGLAPDKDLDEEEARVFWTEVACGITLSFRLAASGARASHLTPPYDPTPSWLTGSFHSQVIKCFPAQSHFPRGGEGSRGWGWAVRKGGVGWRGFLAPQARCGTQVGHGNREAFSKCRWTWESTATASTPSRSRRRRDAFRRRWRRWRPARRLRV
jgi:hypothetical protein